MKNILTIIILFFGVNLFSQYKINAITGEFDAIGVSSTDTITGNVLTKQIAIDNAVDVSTTQTCLSGAADTTGVTPRKVGDLYIDTNASKVYISKTASRGGWIILNSLFLIGLIRRKDEENI